MTVSKRAVVFGVALELFFIYLAADKCCSQVILPGKHVSALGSVAPAVKGGFVLAAIGYFVITGAGLA